MSPQTFLGIDEQGRASVVATEGNPDCHVILRGGEDGPNYDAKSVAQTVATLEKNGPYAHPDDRRQPRKCAARESSDMPATYEAILQQRGEGTRSIIGAMLESNLVAGAQGLADKECLVYGQSITDQCIDWPRPNAWSVKPPSAWRRAKAVEQDCSRPATPSP
jgi:3-deoxy-7-phosphoheptulonate synthase